MKICQTPTYVIDVRLLPPVLFSSAPDLTYIDPDLKRAIYGSIDVNLDIHTISKVKKYILHLEYRLHPTMLRRHELTISITPKI